MVTLRALAASSLCWLSPTFASQEPFLGLTPMKTSSGDFMRFSHPGYPEHIMRTKLGSAGFCDSSVKSYTGYLDIQARHLFFFFFESRNDPAKDDVVLWMNGGPGGSSSMGLFAELGPCTIDSDGNATEYNPYSWNSHSNIIFIDQPVGVGFSYADYGETVDTTEQAAVDVAAFVALFFEAFPQFKNRRFHVTGESYGGRYVPLFAGEIYDQNRRLSAKGMTPVNLASVMIGNGMSDAITMFPSYFDMQCTDASGLSPVTDIQSCVRIKERVTRCQKWLNSACADHFDKISCGAAVRVCEEDVVGKLMATGRNIYDLSKECDGDFMETLCYPIFGRIENYLNLPEVRSELNIDPSFGEYKIRSEEVGEAFSKTIDGLKPGTTVFLEALLERGVRVLLYAGMYDWICNWVGNERMARELNWSLQSEFQSQSLHEWSVNGTAAGLTRSVGPLTFATLYGAGHMAPHDKPAEALALFKSWLDEESL